MAIMEAIELYRLDIILSPFCIVFAKELLYLLKRFSTGKADRGGQKIMRFKVKRILFGQPDKKKSTARGAINSSRRDGIGVCDLRQKFRPLVF